MGGGAGCRRRAISSSARYLRSPSRRTASWPCARQPAACFVATGTVGCAPRPRSSAIPARALVAGPANDRFYLLGRSRLFASEDGGRTYAVVPGLPQMSEMTALAAIPGSADTLAAVIDGRAMISHDGGRTWRDAGFGGAGAPVDTIATDATRPQRIWAAAGGRIVVSDDLGSELAFRRTFAA